MGDRGGRGRGGFAGDRGGRGGGRGGGRDDYGGGRGGGRGDYGGGGGGRGDFGGGRGGDFGGRGGGRGDFGGGGRGGGRDFGGRGGGRGRGVSGGDMALPLQQAVQQLTAAFAGISVKAPEVLRCPTGSKVPSRALRQRAGGVGKAGKPIKVLANHFPMKVTAKQAFHYDVSIDRLLSEEEQARAEKRKKAPPRAGPDRGLPRPMVRRVLNALALQQNWNNVGWASDWGKNIYAPSAFLGTSSEAVHDFTVRTAFTAPDGSNVDKTWKVAIKYAATVDLDTLNKYIAGQLDPEEDLPRSAIQVLEVVLRSGVSARENTLVIGSSVFFYVPNDNNLHMQLPAGAEAWAGYRQAVKPCQFGLSFNIDLAATAFLTSGPLTQVLSSVLNFRDPRQLTEQLNPRALRAIKDTVKGMRVAYRCPSGVVRNKLVRELGTRAASQTTFKLDDGKEVSVAQYYASTYKLNLKFPNLPPLNVSAQPGRKVWVPMELCDVVAGQRRRMLNEQQTTGMLKFAGLPPADRREYLEAVVARPDLGGFNEDPAVKSFGIQIATAMSTVNARVLNPPLLAYGNPQAITPGTRGSWNLRDVKFPAGVQIKSWAFTTLVDPNMLIPDGETGTDTFLRDLVGMCNKTGVACDVPVKGPYDPRDAIETRIKRAADAATQHFGTPCEMVLVLLERKQTSGESPYALVKQAGDSVLGIRTQCFAADKAGVGRNARPPRGRPQYVANIAMKINTKMGGVNVKLVDDPERPGRSVPVVGTVPFMIFGADVTHPTSFNPDDPSIAAVCASYDRTLGRYMSRVLRQGHRQEVIGAMKEVVRDMLMEFYRRNSKRKPEALIYYRDGVADSQFPIVLEHEYTAFREACYSLDASYCPPITFVVVQKRHNTRLFPGDASGADNSGNCLPGTVVDTGICHPTQFDFFLNSHAGLQGHNKPAHYHVLVDENGFIADALQLFTYWQCYLYCRCTRSVSYVPAAYYAHLAAFRGRLMKREVDTGSIVSSGSGEHPPEVLQIPDAYANNCMFFA